MSETVTIFGGSGFVGRYIAQRMARAGWRVRVAVRRPNEALFVKTYGAVGQVEPVLCNIRDDASVRAALHGAKVAINCVGTFDWRGRNDFEAVQHEGAGRVARIAAEAGVTRLVHLSTIGPDAGSDCEYLRTKALGEEAVHAAFPQAHILRPSVIFGVEDGFFNRFASMARFTPVLPVPGAQTRFQPVYVDDVAAAAAQAALGEAAPGIYELGGPDVATLYDLLHQMLTVIRRKRAVLNMPFGVASFFAFWFDLWQTVSGGLIKSPLTRDQVRALKHDSVVSDNAAGFEALGITPRNMAAILPEYLYRYRPSGQYEAITASGKNLKA